MSARYYDPDTRKFLSQDIYHGEAISLEGITEKYLKVVIL